MDEEKIEALGKYLSVAYKAFFSLLDERLDAYEIGAEELHLLIPIYKEGRLPQKTVCEIFHQDKATIARRLEQLEQKGFIRREEDPKDRRRKLIYLTQKSESKRPEFRKILKAIERNLRAELSQEEVETFLLIMKKICRILRTGEEEC
ncbi:MAG: MarR family transcriptional regulator [Candidatus Korarchaeota archaeon]|nr:MarR family transcriptional regulator [Candidatus Korarchaeota archaeon]NIU83699.1 MarR family transcriptional regulator [Candidatus Thorarchaeota archaeon]NIW14884.1 MarR family transcriptional regulator [Candidatus Thorarchaeota archaeon]NIW52016.1 MarR family transcriptional regulator [Candidatus Korarchaeota archaeon]